MISRTGGLWAVVLLAGLFAFCVPAAATQLSVGNPGLEHFDSAGAVQLDFGLTGPDGQPVGNLQVNNIKVFEDGKPAKIVDFRGQGQGRPVDVVFVMDVTESMQPYIDAVKQNIIAFAHELAANNRDYRLGLVTFEDYVVSAYPDCGCAYRNKLTSNVQEFIKWVGGLQAGGGGDIPEDQLDALAYAAKLPLRPDAQGILILITDAPDHHAGDDSAHTQHDQAFWDHHKGGGDVTNRTASQVAALLKRDGLTLYAVAPPPFIAPDYAKIVESTHGRSYNIITQEGRFSELVREIGHSIATEYSLTYITPRPVEDGTLRKVELKVDYGGQTATANTEYQVRGVGGARINVPTGGSGGNAGGALMGSQLSFAWWNGLVPLLAVVGLIALSRMGLGVSREELNAIVAAQSQAPPLRASLPSRPKSGTPPPSSSAPSGAAASGAASGVALGRTVAKLVTRDPSGPIAGEYSLLKDEVAIGRGTENDLVIPHASVSRTHARIVRRNGAFQLNDLGSTNGSFVNGQPVHGWITIANGSEVRLGEVSFTFHV